MRAALPLQAAATWAPVQPAASSTFSRARALRSTPGTPGTPGQSRTRLARGARRGGRGVTGLPVILVNGLPGAGKTTLTGDRARATDRHHPRGHERHHRLDQSASPGRSQEPLTDATPA